MKEQKAAEAVPKEHEEHETKGVKAEQQPKVPSLYTHSSSQHTHEPSHGENEPVILRSRPQLRHHTYFSVFKSGCGGEARDQGHQGRGAEVEGALPTHSSCQPARPRTEPWKCRTRYPEIPAAAPTPLTLNQVVAAKSETKDIKAEEQKPKVPFPSALPNGLGFGEAFRENLENSDPRANPEPIPAPLPCANYNPGTNHRS